MALASPTGQWGRAPSCSTRPLLTIAPSIRSWQTPEGRRWYEGLAQGRTVVRYDSRGCGHSQSDAVDSSLETQISDLEAVADRMGADQFALFGYLYFGPTAIAYAVRHPERVSRLILWCTGATSASLTSPQRQWLTQMVDADWESFVENTVLTWFGFSSADQARSLAAALRQSTSPEKVQALLGYLGSVDVSASLPDIRCPSLVLQRADLRAPNVDAAHYLAAHIPGARLVVLEGDAGIPYVGDADASLAAVREFLGHDGKPPPEPAADHPATIRTILFTDLVGHTEMMQRLGDAKGRDVLREHERITRETLKRHGGTEKRTDGDGFMASFGSVTAAMECAIALQRAFSSVELPSPSWERGWG